jgi:hypothetical protein
MLRRWWSCVSMVEMMRKFEGKTDMQSTFKEHFQNTFKNGTCREQGGWQQNCQMQSVHQLQPRMLGLYAACTSSVSFLTAI